MTVRKVLGVKINFSYVFLQIAALIAGFSSPQYSLSEGGGAIMLNVNVNRQIDAESVVLQVTLIDGTATSKFTLKMHVYRISVILWEVAS